MLMQSCISISQLADVNIETVDRESLVDVSDLTFDNTIPQGQKAAWIMKIVKNPYCFRVGDMGVKLEFLDNAPSFQDVFTNFLIFKKGGL